jgi:hypothetical protein
MTLSYPSFRSVPDYRAGLGGEPDDLLRALDPPPVTFERAGCGLVLHAEPVEECGHDRHEEQIERKSKPTADSDSSCWRHHCSEGKEQEERDVRLPLRKDHQPERCAEPEDVDRDLRRQPGRVGCLRFEPVPCQA